jgi:hypothetical protein
MSILREFYLNYRIRFIVHINTISSLLYFSWTHHIRWIEPDANNPDYVFVAIEAGALVQSHDGGKTWIDRNRQGPYDTHTLATHSKAPRRLYREYLQQTPWAIAINER